MATSFLLSWVFAGLFAFSAGQFDKYCGTKMISCNCGNEGYTVSTEIKQCVRWYRWKPRCDDCKGQPSRDELCAVYRHCLDCEPGIDRCVRCPIDRFGKWCSGVCPTCLNGGSCDRNTGKCTCPRGYHGNECELRDGCPPPLPIEGGDFVHQSVYPIGWKVMYWCDTNRMMKGSPTLECLESGQWNAVSPTCYIACPSGPSPANGNVDHDLELQILTYSCKSGYRMVGQPVRKCSQNSTWLGEQPECIKIITCTLPKNLAEKQVIVSDKQKTSFSPGSKVNYSCPQDYVSLGEECVVCQKDGTWSSGPPKCVLQNLTCSHPGELLNGNMSVIGEGKSVFLRNTVITFECESFHYLEGYKNITCGENDTWSGKIPKCIKMVTCPSLPSLPHGRVDFLEPLQRTGTFFRVSYSSRNSTLPILTPSRPHYGRPLSQNPIPKIPLPSGYYHVGTVAQFSCESNYYDLENSPFRSCQPTGEWSGTQTVCKAKCGRSSIPRLPFILHGIVSKAGQWPWQVGIARYLGKDHPLGEWFIVCGGSLISESWILTAAHCVTYDKTNKILPLESFQLYLGKQHRNDSFDDEFVQVAQISEIHVNPNFEPVTLDSDIALIRLSKDVELTSHVLPVCLPKNDDNDERIKEGAFGMVIGWGENENRTMSDNLQYAEIPVVSQSKCRQGYVETLGSFIVTKNMMCAGFEIGKTISCSGDSGGPFVFPASPTEDKWILEGIVSWGSPLGCGQDRQYAGFTKIRPFIPWIRHFV